jgi:hypothetical protein
MPEKPVVDASNLIVSRTRCIRRTHHVDFYWKNILYGGHIEVALGKSGKMDLVKFTAHSRNMSEAIRTEIYHFMSRNLNLFIDGK